MGVFEAGEVVDYWSQRHNSWIEAQVLKRHCDDQGKSLSYDLDVKLCAEVSKIRKKVVDPTFPRRKEAAGLCSLITEGLSEGWLSLEDVIGAVQASGTSLSEG